MSDPLKIAVFADTKGAKHYLEEMIRMLGYIPEPSAEGTAAIQIKGQNLIVSAAEARKLTLPAKAGSMMNAVRHALEKQSFNPRTIRIGSYELDTYNFLIIGSGENIRLTEKEAAILLYLHDAGGGVVGRQALLDKVWGYADNVETHTLETHIYRLRQKIESDPSNPKILKTEEDGYSLAL